MPGPGAGRRFALVTDHLALPPGASARTARRRLTLDGRDVLAFTQGPFRPCLHPVLAPSGHCVTAERAADRRSGASELRHAPLLKRTRR